MSLNTVTMSGVTKGCHCTQWPCQESQRVVNEYSGHVFSQKGFYRTQWPCLQSQRVVTECSGHVFSQKGFLQDTMAMFAVTKGCQ